jgi:hypothetical protein
MIIYNFARLKYFKIYSLFIINNKHFEVRVSISTKEFTNLIYRQQKLYLNSKLLFSKCLNKIKKLRKANIEK